MYLLNGKEKCNQYNVLKNLLDEKRILYRYLDVSNIPHELLTHLRMYCNTCPIVLGVKHFSTCNETLEYFNDVWIIFMYYIYFMIIIEKQKIEKGVGGVGYPSNFL